jgi:predicted AAA+ superfamily ATPase
MVKIKRSLQLDLGPGQTAFLWGPRKTGKSTYLKDFYGDSLYYDLLKTDIFFRFSKQPWLFREQLEAIDPARLEKPVVVDEVQRVPSLLDEIHHLIEARKLSFILCGSSARKLKRGKGNLLGGRAKRYEMFPLTYRELGSLNLLEALNRGLVPSHYFAEDYRELLTGYNQDYLREEVFAEGLARNIPAFSRFFDALGYSHGEITNFSNIARDAGVDAKTVKGYYQILVDTMLGRWVEPFARRSSRQILTKAAKFYLFDVGVAGALTHRFIPEERGEAFGRALEHLVFMELAAHASYSRLHYDIRYWRTKTGYEVDFVLAQGTVAVEVKGSSQVDGRELRPLAAFAEDYRPREAILVCNEREERLSGRIRIMPWRSFLEALWAGKIVG